MALWKGGCYVTATPDVLYLKDTDGDGRADERRKVFSGFKKLNVQAVINNPRWGLDHKLYCDGASNGGEISKPGDPSFKPVRFGRADFAFDPKTEAFEVLTGRARFGQTFDDYGNRFLCNIRNPVQHVVFENHYLARNPHLVVTNAVHDCAEAGDTLPVFRASPPEQVFEPEVVHVNDLLTKARSVVNSNVVKIECTTVKFPFKLIDFTQNTYTINTIETLNHLVSDSSIQIIDFVYPLQIIDNLGIEKTANSLWDFAEYAAGCDHKHWKYPIIYFQLTSSMRPILVIQSNIRLHLAKPMEALL